MKTGLYFLLLFLLLTIGMFAEKTATLNDLMKPETIQIHQEKIYITDGIHIYIYKTKDFKLEKKIGKPGQGPREFIKSPRPWFPDIHIFVTDKLVVNSHGKVSFFSLDGTFLSESKTSSNARFTPLEKKFVSVGIGVNDKGNYFSYNLHKFTDGKLIKEKEFFSSTFPEQQGKKINPILMAEMRKVFFRYAYKDRVYIPTYDGRIHVFDSTGKEVLNFMPPYKKVKFTSALEKKYDEFFLQDIRYKMPYQMDKGRNNIEFPGYLALLKDYRVSDDRVYLVSSKKINGLYDSFIYALQGKLIKNILLPIQDQNIMQLFPFTIAGGKIYQLIENEDDEEWELHITAIK